MNGFEILCMIFGIWVVSFIRPTEWKYINNKQLLMQIIHYTIVYLGGLALIIFPLYFRYWKWYNKAMKFEQEICRDCEGTGKILGKPCKRCNGLGYINVEKTNQFNYCGYCGTPLNKNPKCPKCGRMNK